MANFVGSARSNYFEVKDEEAFLSWVEGLGGVSAYGEVGKDGKKRFTLLADGTDDGCWPSWRPILQAGPFSYDGDRVELEAWVRLLPEGTTLQEGPQGLYLTAPEDAPWPGEAGLGEPRGNLPDAFLGWLVAKFVSLGDAGPAAQAALAEHLEHAEEEVDLAAELVPFLAQGSTAVFEEVGAERLRYLAGYATAVDHAGNRVEVSLSDVYEKAVRAGMPKPTSATY